MEVAEPKTVAQLRRELEGTLSPESIALPSAKRFHLMELGELGDIVAVGFRLARSPQSFRVACGQGADKSRCWSHG